MLPVFLKLINCVDATLLFSFGWHLYLGVYKKSSLINCFDCSLSPPELLILKKPLYRRLQRDSVSQRSSALVATPSD